MLRGVGTILVWLGGGVSLVVGDALADGVWPTEHRGIAAEASASLGRAAGSDAGTGWSAASGMAPDMGRDERDRFFDIWLVERGRSPQLTRRLLGQ